MTFTFKRTALSLAFAGAFTLTGCNFIGDSDPVFTSAPVTSDVQIEAVKGALEDATVVVCELKSACATTTSPSDSVAGTLAFDVDGTDASGMVTLDLTVDSARAILVRVIGDSNTMQVDDYDGASTADLNGLELKTVVFIDNGDTSVSAPVNVLTTIASDTMITLDGPVATKADFMMSAGKASDGVAKLLGIDKDELANAGFNLFSAPVKSATAAGTNVLTQKMSVINASFGALGGNGQTLAMGIQQLSTGVATVLKPASPTATIDTSVIGAAMDKVLAKIPSTQTKASITTPVTVSDSSQIAIDVKDAIDAAGSGVDVTDAPVTGGTGSTGSGSTGGNS